jgi:hydrogenase maturation protease
MSEGVLVIGMGNDYRCDDAVGPIVARAAGVRLAEAGLAATVLDAVADPLDLLGRWDDAALAVIVDAVRSGAPAGSVSVVDLCAPSDAPGAPPGAAQRLTSTHGIGAMTALRLARAVGRAPRRVVLVTVEGSAFARGDTLSPAVAEAVTEAVDRVLEAAGAPVPGIAPRVR